MDLTVTLLDRLTVEVQGNSYDGVDFNKLFLGIDFSKDEISLQSYKNIARILSIATKNENIDKTDMLVAFCLLTKQTLVSNGLDDVKISYIHKSPEQVVENATTFYSDKDKTINLFFEDILDEVVLKKLNAPIAPLARTVEIVRQINIMKQEVQNAQQFELFRLFAKNPNLTPPNVYISQKQYLATTLSKKKGKYLSYDLLTKASGDNGLNYGDFSKYGVVSFSGVNDSDHEWSILTNPKQSFVTTSYMAGVVLCDVLRKLSKEDRAVFAKEYPVVFLAFNDDGTRKTLLEIEKDRDQKLKNLSNIKDKKQQGLEKTAVVSLYETIIESDAVLSLERCLKHLTNLSWESERYFVPKNEDNKYSPTSIREEMKLVSEKAKAIVSIIEGDGAEFVEPILRVFEKTILDYTKDKNADQTFLDDKKHYMFSITNLYFKNDDLALAPRDKVLKSDDKRKEIDRAVKTLKIVFPSLLPNPTVFGVSKEGKYIELPNIDERIMLDIAWEGYRAAYITKKDDDPDLLGVEPIDLQRAIRLVYPYNEYSIEDRLVVEEKIKNGEILLTPNLYEIVTEEDFYGDSEDEEMIVDTDDELDYNRFFVVKDDKKEETLQSETTKEDKKVEETEVVDDKEEQKEEVLTEKNISKEDQKPIKTVENKEEKPQEEAQKTAKAKEKQNKSLEKLAKNVGKVIDIKTQNAISSIEEVVIKKEKEKEEKEKLAKVKPLKEGKDVKQQFAEFEKVLEDIEKPAEIVEQKQPETVNKEEKAEAESIAVEEKSENKDEISIENIEEKDLKETENTESEDEKPEEKLIEESEKESKNESNEENLSEKDNKKEDIVDQQIDGLIEEVDKLIEETDKSSDDDDADLGKKEDNVDDVVVEKEEDKSETEEKPKEEKSKEITEKPKVNTIKEELEDGDKLTGEELLQKYFQYKEEQERIEAEKERLRAEAAARGEPYEEGEEVKIPVEPTKEDVYNSAIEIEDVDPNKKKKDD